MSNNVIQIPGFPGGDPANEKTQRIDTTSGPVAAALNLDFLDLPDDLGQTTPAVPGGRPVPDFPQMNRAPAPPAPPAPQPAGQVQQPAPQPQGLNPMAYNAPSGMTSIARAPAAGGSAGRYVKMAALFFASFVVVGAGVFYLNSMGDSGLDEAFDAPKETGLKETSTKGIAVVEESSLLDSILNPVLELLGLAEAPMPPPPEKPVQKVAKKPPPPPAEPVDDGYPDGNVDVEVRDPYRIILNEIDKDALEALNKGRRPMSVIEEDGWRAAIIHKFPYQHYRAVEEMRSFRAAGSEAILRDALADRSLWVRMSAAFALVESGIPLMASDVEAAVGKNERANLLNGYFQRFVRSSNMAERYVLKFALPLVPDAARIDILEALVNGGDADAELFAIAGSFDNSPRVRRWATNWLARHPSALLRMDEYREALEVWKLTDLLSSNVALARAGDPAGRRVSPGGKAPLRRATGDRPVPVPGAGTAGASNVPGLDVPAGAGEGTQVEFYRQD